MEKNHLRKVWRLKIALCFSGQPRSFEKGFEYYQKNLFDHYDVDVFIHTWKCAEANDLVDVYKPTAIMADEPLKQNFD